MSQTVRIRRLATEVLALARSQGATIATAESCTGGLVAGALTGISGSSDVVDRGFVTYSNAAKQEMLGVSVKTLETYGAVSPETAAEMALGALKHSRATVTVSITGIAGPGGGSEAKPVGLVQFAAAHRDGVVNRIERRFGDIGRADVRARAVVQALLMLKEMLEASSVQSA